MMSLDWSWSNQLQNSKADKKYFVYMVRCQNNSLYTGFSTNVEARMKTHNSGKGAKAVKMMGLPVELVYKEECNNLSSALIRENEIKKMTKKKKEQLINGISNATTDTRR